MGPRIRPYTDADEPAVVALWREALPDAAPHNDPAVTIRKKMAVGGDLFWVAEIEGAVAGTVMGGYDGHRGWVYALAVSEPHRRRGVGRTLVRRLEAALAERGCLKVNLQVRASNAGVVAFYERLGYGVEDRLSLGKRLSEPEAIPGGTRAAEIVIRPATAADLGAIREIYNYYVARSTCTFQLEPDTEAERLAWFQARGVAHPAVVAESASEVVGWAALSPWKPRSGYARSVEASVYVHHDHIRRGIGRALMQNLIGRARAAGHHTVIGGACTEQAASLALLESLGFERVAFFKQVGSKFGRWLDVAYTQLSLA